MLPHLDLEVVPLLLVTHFGVWLSRTADGVWQTGFDEGLRKLSERRDSGTCADGLPARRGESTGYAVKLVLERSSAFGNLAHCTNE